MIRFFLGILVGFLIALALLLSVADFLSLSDAPEPSDAIVALSGDDYETRTRTAVSLYRAGYGRVVIFSGGTDDTASFVNANGMRELAESLFVPARAIMLEPKSRSVQESAHNVRDLMQRERFNAILLVTSPYQQRRAAFEYATAFAETHFTFRSVPAQDPDWDPSLWWLRPALRDRVLLEIVQLVLLIQR